MAQVGQQTGKDKTAIRPFKVNVPEAELTELRKRVHATKWPERETVNDASQGVQLATIHALARYWTEYDWRNCEARLNALPQFITEIDGLDIHFIHARSKHENALPLIVTHGWPGSIVEQMKIIEPLTNPSAHGGKASDAFHLTLTKRPFPGRRHRRVSQLTRGSPTSVCSSCIKRESPTDFRWGCDRRHYMESRTHPSAWRLISSITTRAAMS